MARSAAIPLAIGGFASVLLISGLQGESLAEVLKGEFGKGTKHPTPSVAQQEQAAFNPSEGEVGVGGSNIPQPQFASFGGAGGLISPFPRSSGPISWGRSDQGVDGIVKPGSPLVAMGNGIVEVASDPAGFGNQYPILKIDNDGAFYYGHSIPAVPSGTRVKAGETIGFANIHGQGNANTPGSFEIGRTSALGQGIKNQGAEIREWFLHLPRL